MIARVQIHTLKGVYDALSKNCLPIFWETFNKFLSYALDVRIRLSFYKRNAMFILVITVASVLSMTLLSYGIALNWNTQTLAVTLSSILSGTSIALLVVEKIYDRPNFVVTIQREVKTRTAPRPSTDLVFTIRNDGFRGVNSMRVKASFLTSRYYELHRTDFLLLADIPNTIGHSLALKLDVGTEAEIFLPLEELNKTRGLGDHNGFIRLALITAYGVYFVYFRYSINNNEFTESFSPHTLGLDWIDGFAFEFANMTNKTFAKKPIKLPATYRSQQGL